MYLWKMRDIKGKLNYYLKENYIEIKYSIQKIFFTYKYFIITALVKV